MPVATITTTTLAPTWDKAGLAAAMQTAMANAGLGSTVDTVITGSTDLYIFAPVVNPSVVKSTAYLIISINSTNQISQGISDNWDFAANGATGTMTQANASYTTSNTITFTAINHPEFRQVRVFNGAALTGVLGYFRPANPPNWWNENNHLYAFQTHLGSSTTLINGYPPQPNPMNSSVNNPGSISRSGQGFLSLIHTTPGGQRDLIDRPPLFWNGSNNQYIIGRFSDDFVVGASSGMVLGDQFEVGLTRYALVEQQTTSSASLAIRVA
jgi:hypothetical protein